CARERATTSGSIIATSRHDGFGQMIAHRCRRSWHARLREQEEIQQGHDDDLGEDYRAEFESETQTSRAPEPGALDTIVSDVRRAVHLRGGLYAASSVCNATLSLPAQAQLATSGGRRKRVAREIFRR